MERCVFGFLHVHFVTKIIACLCIALSCLTILSSIVLSVVFRNVTVGAISGGSSVVALMAFISSVLLLIGMKRKRPAFYIPYLIFAVFGEIVFLIVIACYYIVSVILINNEIDVNIGIGLLFAGYISVGFISIYTYFFFIVVNRSRQVLKKELTLSLNENKPIEKKKKEVDVDIKETCIGGLHINLVTKIIGWLGAIFGFLTIFLPIGIFLVIYHVSINSQISRLFSGFDAVLISTIGFIVFITSSFLLYGVYKKMPILYIPHLLLNLISTIILLPTNLMFFICSVLHQGYGTFGVVSSVYLSLFILIFYLPLQFYFGFHVVDRSRQLLKKKKLLKSNIPGISMIRAELFTMT